MARSIFSTKVTVDIIDLVKMATTLRNGDFSKPLQQTAYEMVQNAKRRIRKQMDVYGRRFKSLSPRTIADKIRLRSSQPKKALWRTGAMYRSITYGKIKKNLYRVYVASPDDFKAQVHNIEARHMRRLPVRQFLLPDYMTPLEQKHLSQRIHRYVDNVLKKAYTQRAKRQFVGGAFL